MYSRMGRLFRDTSEIVTRQGHTWKRNIFSTRSSQGNIQNMSCTTSNKWQNSAETQAIDGKDQITDITEHAGRPASECQGNLNSFGFFHLLN